MRREGHDTRHPDTLGQNDALRIITRAVLARLTQGPLRPVERHRLAVGALRLARPGLAAPVALRMVKEIEAETGARAPLLEKLPV